jgi:thiol-disulfide isomerase/thioredoxin
MLRTILLSCFLMISIISWGQIQTDAEEAFKISSETHKPVLLVFAGSDWCAPCMRFEKTILKESTFQHFASDNLVILKADFPQREKLPMSVQEQNEKLAERYNPKGIFPAFLLLRDDRTVLSSSLQFHNQSSTEFITEIKSLLQ